MKKYYFLSLVFLSQLSMAQNSMDAYRWYLNPNGQQIRIAIDDLNDEILTASPKMDWGRNSVPGLALKKDVVIAVIDGGIDIEHPELKGKIALNSVECFEGSTIPPQDGEDKDGNGYKGDCAGWNFVDNNNRAEDLDGHGTHVTGIINTVLSGVEGHYKFLPIKTFAPGEGRNSVSGLAPLFQRLTKAFDYAISRKVDVIHLSVGWPKSYQTIELEQVIQKAIAQGIIIVSAAGNSSQRANIFPCQMEGVICVGALRPNGEVARFSNWGMQVDVMAPGERILSTIPFEVVPQQISRKGYDYKNGTSQAAPFISAAMALLRGHFPDESKDLLFARLLEGADPAVKGKSLKGLFHLDRSLNMVPESYVLPVLKGIGNILVSSDGSFSFRVPFKNYGVASSYKLNPTITCSEAQIKPLSSLGVVKPSERLELQINGRLVKKSNEINCELALGAQIISLKLKVLNNLKASIKEVIAPQDDRYMINTRTGGKSRLLTLMTMKGSIPGPLYYVSGMNEPLVYHENIRIGSVKPGTGCKILRLWQLDLNQDGQTEIMMESICDDNHLSYRFYDLNLKELWPEVKYRPSLTIVNYDDFKIIPQKDSAPIFRFINGGLNVPSTDPWVRSDTGRAAHLYELFPVKKEDGWKYDVRVMENEKSWQASLGLRYMPQTQVYHLMGERLLVKIGQKMAWVDIKTQTATWAGLEQFLLDGTKRQSIVGTKDEILQGFLTPYEYRGVMLNGTVLGLSQQNKFDPLVDIISTSKNALGFMTILQSFQKLIYVQYDFKGGLLSRNEVTVDRFDFLSGQDLLASVVNLETGTGSIQIVDGTKLNTSYVDVVKEGKVESFSIPNECVTQQPVMLDGAAVLPIFCAISANEFKMDFIGL
jgi:hypothetical protein